MITRTFTILCLSAMASTSMAQFPVIGTAPETINEVIYTCSSGKKLLHQGVQGAATVYNLDLTVFVQIVPPTLTPPLTVSGTSFISQDLFDSDPSTVEYVLSYFEAIPGGLPGVMVMRTDGTVLFNAFPAAISMALADEWGIYNTPGGAVMVIENNTQPPPYTSTLYQLPGSLPCFDCTSGNIAMVAPEVEAVGEGDAMMLFPNPTDGAVSIRYALPDRNGRADLVIFDLQGAVVKRMPVSGSGTLSFTTSDLAAGTYLCQLQSEQGVVGAKRLVVLR